jgi:hypothetical protein
VPLELSCFTMLRVSGKPSRTPHSRVPSRCPTRSSSLLARIHALRQLSIATMSLSSRCRATGSRSWSAPSGSLLDPVRPIRRFFPEPLMCGSLPTRPARMSSPRLLVNALARGFPG